MVGFITVVVCSQRKNISKWVVLSLFEFLILEKSGRSVQQPRNVCGPP